MNQIVKANDITSKENAKSVLDLKSQGDDIEALKRLFTGDSGDQLYMRTGDYVVWKGITLKTGDGHGIYASGWTHAIKTYAADELGERENPNIVRKSCDGSTLWNVEWLQEHFPAIRKRVAAENEKPKVFF